MPKNFEPYGAVGAPQHSLGRIPQTGQGLHVRQRACRPSHTGCRRRPSPSSPYHPSPIAPRERPREGRSLAVAFRRLGFVLKSLIYWWAREGSNLQPDGYEPFAGEGLSSDGLIQLHPRRIAHGALRAGPHIIGYEARGFLRPLGRPAATSFSPPRFQSRAANQFALRPLELTLAFSRHSARIVCASL